MGARSGQTQVAGSETCLAGQGAGYEPFEVLGNYHILRRLGSGGMGAPTPLYGHALPSARDSKPSRSALRVRNGCGSVAHVVV